MSNKNKYIYRCVFTNTVFHLRTTTELTTNISTAIAKTLGIHSHSQIVEVIVRSVSLNPPFHISNQNHIKLTSYTPDLLHPQPPLQWHRKYLTHPHKTKHFSTYSYSRKKDVVSIHHRPRTRQISNPSLHHEHLHKLPRHRLHRLRHLLRGPASDVVGRRIAPRRRQRHCGP